MPKSHTPPPPTPGVSPTDGTSIDAAPEGVSEHSQLALAKLNLMDAARAIRPLDPLRNHPWTTVSVAAGAGAVLGSASGSAGAMVGLSGLMRSLSSVIASLSGVLGPLASIIGPMVAGKVAAATTKDDAAEAVANAQATGDPNVPPDAAI